MEKLLKVLEAYQHWDPQGWTAFAAVLPSWGGVLLALVGLLFLLVGGGRLFRLVAAPVGALVGILWVPLVLQQLGFSQEGRRVQLVAAVVLGGLGLGLPQTASFLGLGVPAGLLGGAIAGANDWALGFVPGFLVAGSVGLSVHRFLSAIVASVLGGWCFVLGLLCGLRSVLPAADAVLHQPWGVMAAAALFAMAGTVYQLFVRLSPKERMVAKVDQARAKRKSREQSRLEKRWTSYSKDKGL